MGGSSDACLQIFLVAETIHTMDGQLRQVLTPAHGFSSGRSYGLSWDNEGRTWHLLTSLIEAASACLWSLRWQQWLTPAPRAPRGGALLPGSAHREKSTYGGPTSLLVSLFLNNGGLPLWQAQAPSDHTLSFYNLTSSDCFCTSNPSPSPGSDLQILSFSIWSPPVLTEACLRLGTEGQKCWISVQGTLHFTFHKPVAALSC